MTLRLISLILFAIDVHADAKVGDHYGAAFWAIAIFVFGVLAVWPHGEVFKKHRWLSILWNVLIAFSIAVFFIRVVFGYTG